MLVMRIIEDPANPVCELVGSEQTLGFYDLALSMIPLRLYGVQPQALLREKATDDLLTPSSPLFLASGLRLRSHRLTSLETCQLALSQMRSRIFLPAASSFSRLHSRNCVVMGLTGLPSTNLNHVSSISGR